MWGFSVAAFALLAMVMAVVLPTLLRPQAQQNTSTQAERRAVFRGQFDDLEQDKNTGLLSEVQYQTAKTELERRMLDEIGHTVDAVQRGVRPDMKMACLLAVLVPLMAFGIYSQVGSPQVLHHPNLLLAEQEAPSQAQVEALLAAIKAKLADNPSDAEGWALLGRANARLGRLDEAIAAFEQASKLTPNDPDLLADYADVMAIANGYQLAGKPEALLAKALKINPNHEKSLKLAGAAAFERKDYAQVAELWGRLKAILPQDSAILPELEAAIKKAQQLAAEPSNTPQTKAAVSVAGTVRVAAALAGQVDPDATLFVYARAATSTPMPIAIVKVKAQALPYEFKLDDSNAAMPNQALSQVTSVILVARISKTGEAKPQPGDLQGISSLVQLDGKVKADIEINEVVK